MLYAVCAAVSVHLQKAVGRVLLCDNGAPVVLHQAVCGVPMVGDTWCVRYRVVDMILVCLGESKSELNKKKTTHITKGLINKNKSSLWPFTGIHSKYSISSRC